MLRADLLENLRAAAVRSGLTPVAADERLYETKGQYDEAESLYLTTLGARERVLGTEQPDTDSMNDLAIQYRKLGRYAEAEP